MIRKEIGKIKSAYFGLGGYQECQFGLWLTLGGESWDVGHGIIGGWNTSMKPSNSAKWTEQSRLTDFGTMAAEINNLMNIAKIRDLNDLVDIPVECEFDGMILATWRILKEVL